MTIDFNIWIKIILVFFESDLKLNEFMYFIYRKGFAFYVPMNADKNYKE